MALPLALDGRVVLEYRQIPPEPVPVQLLCPGKTSTEWTDAKGRFAIPLGHQASEVAGAVPRMEGCRVVVSLPEFRVIERKLGLVQSPASLNLGDLVLSPVAGRAGGSFSATSWQAPSAARRLYIQALEQIGARDFNAAIATLDKAAIKYPSYAAAYQMKGQVLDRIGARELARASFERAALADPAYTKPLIQLAQLAAEDQDPEEAARRAEQVNRIAPGEFPDMYLLEGASYYNLDRFSDAERTAKAGIGADRGNTLPRLHKLLGEALYRRSDFSGALAQYLQYLEEAPQAPDAPEIQAKAESCRRLASILSR